MVNREHETQPHSQGQYQVRFDWGVAGARLIAPRADVVIWVDVLGSGESDCSPPDLGIPTIGATLRNRRAVAEWVLGRQGDKGDRFTVAVVAAGELRDDATVRFALEDLLGAGAVIDALADLGIDYCSPEAAAASAAFTGLRNATGHLIGSSASGQELTEAGRRDDVEYAVELDVSEEILLRREFSPAH